MKKSNPLALICTIQPTQLVSLCFEPSQPQRITSGRERGYIRERERQADWEIRQAENYNPLITVSVIMDAAYIISVKLQPAEKYKALISVCAVCMQPTRSTVEIQSMDFCLHNAASTLDCGCPTGCIQYSLHDMHAEQLIHPYLQHLNITLI